MAYSFEFDAASRTLLAKFRGRVTDEELMRFYRVSTPRVLATIDFESVINDFSSVTAFEVMPETVRALAWSTPAVPDPAKIRIIVAPTPILYGMARDVRFSRRGYSTESAHRPVARTRLCDSRNCQSRIRTARGQARP